MLKGTFNIYIAVIQIWLLISATVFFSQELNILFFVALFYIATYWLKGFTFKFSNIKFMLILKSMVYIGILFALNIILLTWLVHFYQEFATHSNYVNYDSHKLEDVFGSINFQLSLFCGLFITFTAAYISKENNQQPIWQVIFPLDTNNKYFRVFFSNLHVVARIFIPCLYLSAVFIIWYANSFNLDLSLLFGCSFILIFFGFYSISKDKYIKIAKNKYSLALVILLGFLLLQASVYVLFSVFSITSKVIPEHVIQHKITFLSEMLDKHDLNQLNMFILFISAVSIIQFYSLFHRIAFLMKKYTVENVSVAFISCSIITLYLFSSEVLYVVDLPSELKYIVFAYQISTLYKINDASKMMHGEFSQIDRGQLNVLYGRFIFVTLNILLIFVISQYYVHWAIHSYFASAIVYSIIYLGVVGIIFQESESNKLVET